MGYLFFFYQTDLRQIFRVGRTTAVDDKSELSFSVPQRSLSQRSTFVGLVHGCRWTQVASGAVGRANVGFALHIVPTVSVNV